MTHFNPYRNKRSLFVLSEGIRHICNGVSNPYNHTIQHITERCIFMVGHSRKKHCRLDSLCKYQPVHLNLCNGGVQSRDIYEAICYCYSPYVPRANYVFSFCCCYQSILRLQYLILLTKP